MELNGASLAYFHQIQIKEQEILLYPGIYWSKEELYINPVD